MHLHFQKVIILSCVILELSYASLRLSEREDTLNHIRLLPLSYMKNYLMAKWHRPIINLFSANQRGSRTLDIELCALGRSHFVWYRCHAVSNCKWRQRKNWKSTVFYVESVGVPRKNGMIMNQKQTDIFFWNFALYVAVPGERWRGLVKSFCKKLTWK